MSYASKLKSVILGLSLAIAFSGQASARTINELQAEYDTLVNIEAELLDQRSALQARLDDPDLLFLPRADGGIREVRRGTIEREVGRIYDWLVLFGADERIIASLPADQRAIATAMTWTGTARGAAIDRVVTDLTAISADARQEKQAELGRTEVLLETIRQWANDTLAERDAEVIRMNTGAVASSGAEVCLDDSVAADRYATYWQLGYGGSPRYPVKGNFICRENGAVEYYGASTIELYRCNLIDRSCALIDRPGLRFTREVDQTTGRPILLFEDGGTVTFWPG